VANTGRISIVNPNGIRRILLSGLPSGINDVQGVTGPQGLFMRGRTLYVAIGVGDVSVAGPIPGSDLPNPQGPSSPLFSSVLAIHFSSHVENTTAGFTLSSDDQNLLAAGGKLTLSHGGGDEITIELIANFPNYVPKPLPLVPENIGHSNPFGLVAVGDQLYVTDGGQNKLWQVDLPTGSFRTLTEFPVVANPLFSSGGPGGPTEEAVPTGITYSGGRLLVALFRGAPFAPGTSTVEQVDPVTGGHSGFISGLKTAIATLPVKDRGNTDYLVLQHASTGPFFASPGLLLHFASPTSPGVLLTNCLVLPTAMALDEKTGNLYVTELGGQIVAIRL
jgi:hypothetical protein